MLGSKSIFLSLAFLVFFCSYASAQNEPSIIMTTSPPGATVYLRGEMDLVAHTPANLPANISGRFKAEITRPGYESWKGEFTFVPGKSQNIAIALSRKTRAKAMLRSVLIPGWGQIYSGNEMRGYLFTGSALLAAAAVYHLDKRYDKKKTDYDIALDNYNAATAIEDRIMLKTILDDRHRDAYNAETDRNTVFLIGAALWGYNILDAVLFFPEGEAYFPSMTAIDNGAVLTFNIAF